MLNLTSNKELKEKILKFCEPPVIFSKIPYEKFQEYFEILNIPEIKSLLNDEELMHTVSVFFENNLNISTTSKAAFMHRNTLIYRLGKIQREIGLNIKNFEEARVLKTIILVNNILKEKNKK